MWRGLQVLCAVGPASSTTAMAAPAAVPGVYIHASRSTGTRYMLSTMPNDQRSAEADCVKQGGHLVSYESDEEQAEVEKFFFDYGVLLPGYHTFYWLGLNTTAERWPAFSYLDGAAAPNASVGAYAGWGNYSEAASSNVTVPEPNNLFAPEYCAGANYSEMGFDGEGADSFWPWSDTSCTAQPWPLMCKLLREWRSGGTISELGSSVLLVPKDAGPVEQAASVR